MKLAAKLRQAADLIDALEMIEEPHADGSPDTFAFHLVEGFGACGPERDFRTVRDRTEARKLAQLSPGAAEFLFNHPDIEANYGDQSGICRALAAIADDLKLQESEQFHIGHALRAHREATLQTDPSFD